MDENLNPEVDTTPEQEGQLPDDVSAAEGNDEKAVKEADAQNTNASKADGAEASKDIPENFLEIKFNKQSVNLSREEAVTLAQKGMKYDSISEDYLKLKDHAARNGKSLSEFVKGLEEAEIDVIRQQCKETADGNEEYEQLLFEKALKERDIKLQEYNNGIAAAEQQEKEALENKIANGIIAINKINPEIKEVSQLSDTVLKRAEEEGISIREAYLLSVYENNKAVEDAEKAAADASKRSPGSLKDTGGNEMSTTDKQFLAGLWGR
ncbi:MAG: hypothetical protein E7568_05645 [Ruminococcaceae bacterium]|nr:hypothetical protein [Oscillospiraceae bacterium]